jgi:glycosyltransferase involved in cell wall biosynthesis
MVDETSDLPSVAICIPTYNQAQYLPDAVRSAYGQDYGGALEVWVADDASTDATPEVIRQLEREYPELHTVRQARNLGTAENSTAALRAPLTEFAVRLDSDDVLAPQFVSRLTQLMMDHVGAGYGHSAVAEIDEQGQLRRVRRLSRATGFQSADVAFRASLSGHRAAGNITMFRKSALDVVSYYAGRADSVEDYDLSVRLADAGYGNVYTGDALASRRVWADTAGVRARRKALQLEGYRRLFDDSIYPAWKRRGWDLTEVSRQRARLASRNCPSCFAAQYSAQERDELVSLLLQLGDGRGVRLRLAICRLGCARVLERIDRLPGPARHLAKAVLSEVRRRR